MDKPRPRKKTTQNDSGNISANEVRDESPLSKPPSINIDTKFDSPGSARRQRIEAERHRSRQQTPDTSGKTIPLPSSQLRISSTQKKRRQTIDIKLFSHELPYINVLKTLGFELMY